MPFLKILFLLFFFFSSKSIALSEGEFWHPSVALDYIKSQSRLLCRRSYNAGDILDIRDSVWSHFPPDGGVRQKVFNSLKNSFEEALLTHVVKLQHPDVRPKYGVALGMWGLLSASSFVKTLYCLEYPQSFTLCDPILDYAQDFVSSLIQASALSLIYLGGEWLYSNGINLLTGGNRLHAWGGVFAPEIDYVTLFLANNNSHFLALIYTTLYEEKLKTGGDIESVLEIINKDMSQKLSRHRKIQDSLLEHFFRSLRDLKV